MKKDHLIIAVDFDGCLIWEQGFGELNTEEALPNERLMNWLIERKNAGDKVILWTCREDHDERKLLTWAVDYCKGFGLEFDAVNDNIKPNNYEWQPRKVFADLYIDDRGVSFVRDKFLTTHVGWIGDEQKETLDWTEYHLNKYIEETSLSKK